MMTGEQAPGRGEPYRPNGGRAKAVLALFAVTIAAQVVLAIVTALQIGLLHDIAAGRPAPDPVLEASDERVVLAARLYLAIFVVTGILFLRWLYRAYYNLVPLGATRRAFTLGWSAGWFFIPFYNLVRPYQVVTEIRSAADEPGDVSHATSGQTLVSLWWATSLLMGAVSRVERILWRNAETAEPMITASYVSLAGTVVAVIAAVFAILLVQDITGGQERRAARLLQPGEAAPVG